MDLESDARPNVVGVDTMMEQVAPRIHRIQCKAKVISPLLDVIGLGLSIPM